MRIISVILVVSLSLSAMAQQPLPGNISVLQHKPISFNLNNAEDLLRTQSIDNAFEIQMFSEPLSMNVYVQAVFYNSAVRNSFSGKLYLKLANSTSPNAVFSRDEIMLSHTPVLLFRQPRSTSPVRQLMSFNYNILLKPLEDFIKPDAHAFSLIITVTPE